MKENKLKKSLKVLGPGLVSGAADDDPSGIATYSQMGAMQGFRFLWVSLFSFPLMVVVQEMCARISLATGSGIAENIKENYSKKILYFCTLLLVFANVLNIGADLGAMAKGVQLLFPSFNFFFLIIFFVLLITLSEIFISYKKYSKYLKYLTLVLFSYIFSVLIMKISWSSVWTNLFIPKIAFNKEEILLLCAALGTTISPYLFFWQSGQEIEEKILKGDDTIEKRKNDVSKSDIKNMRKDVIFGMFFSNLIMFFIIVACASTLYKAGITNIGSAEEAALALKPFAGEFSFILFAFGIIGTGLLAVPVLAGSTAYAVSESFGFKSGLFRKFSEAHHFYGVIIVAMVLGMFLNFLGFDPMKILIYSAILNGIISPILLFFIIQISSNQNIMKDYKNSSSHKIFGYFIFFIMSFVSIASIIYLFF